jgi:6-phosphogluconolactonase
MNRREFVVSAAAVAVSAPSLLAQKAAKTQRVLVGSNTPEGILAFDWDAQATTFTPAGVAAKIANVDWLIVASSAPDKNYLFAASEVDETNGKPTGAVASFLLEAGKLKPIATANSAAKGTCHIALDHTSRVLLSADYGGGAAASFLIGPDGNPGQAVWTEHYSGHGPVTDRQEAVHAHFASFSPDNRFAYINDLGSDAIHIYRLDAQTAKLTPAGAYHSKPGAGPRTLHFHPCKKTAYAINELDSTVDVLAWNKSDGSLKLKTRIELLPAGSPAGKSRACDTVITSDGRNVYFANRGDDFLYAFRADVSSGELKPIGRTPTGGKSPRNFTLDPSERWMLVANQDSNSIAIFERNPNSGALASQGKNLDCPAPMCILFV